MLQDNYLTGVGYNNFKLDYGLYQANYFASGHFTTKELLLADNTRHAFNDYLQFVIETGLGGACFLVFGLVVILRFIRRAFKKDQPSELLKTAGAQVVALSIAALFTHVFEHVIFQLIYLQSLLILAYFSEFMSLAKVKLIIWNIIAIMLFWGLNYGPYFYHFKEYQDFEDADNLLNSGYLQESADKCRTLYPQLKDDTRFLHTYAKALFSLSHYKHAATILEEINQISSSNLVYQQLGNCYFQCGRLKNAERAYLLAVNMVPNRFSTRFDLLNLYLTSKQRQKAINTATNIMKLPVKVPSNQIDMIREETGKHIKFLR